MISFDELKPGDILKTIEDPGIAFIPVGPLEWHGPHLPYGTDAIIAESICKNLAEKTGGVFFKALNYGLDSYRTKAQLHMWGFKKNEKIFGMNFPELPLVSEYCSPTEMKKNIIRRLKFLKDCKFRAALVVNHHGGKNQVPLIKKICKELKSNSFAAEAIYAMDFCTLKTGLPESVGTHAGIWETQMVMAYRPELVDLSRITDSRIIVKKIGIAHNKPEIEDEFDPRNSDYSIAEKIKENIILNLFDYISEKYLKQ